MRSSRSKFLTLLIVAAMALTSVVAFTACDFGGGPRRTPTYTVPTGLTATYGQTLGDVTLPGGWAWVSAAATPVGAVGARIHNATFTPASANYYSVTRGATITVNAATTPGSPGTPGTPGRQTPATPTFPAGYTITAVYGQTLAEYRAPTPRGLGMGGGRHDSRQPAVGNGQQNSPS